MNGRWPRRWDCRFRCGGTRAQRFPNSFKVHVKGHILLMAGFVPQQRHSISKGLQYITLTRYQLSMEPSASPQLSARSCLQRTCSRRWQEPRSACAPSLASLECVDGDCITMWLFQLSRVISQAHWQNAFLYFGSSLELVAINSGVVLSYLQSPCVATTHAATCALYPKVETFFWAFSCCLASMVNPSSTPACHCSSA